MTVARRNALTFLGEVGFRVAVRMESRPRDMQWWYGLWEAR